MRQKPSSVLVTLCSLCFAFALIACVQSVNAQSKRGTVIKLQDVKVVGKLQKPQAFYVLHRAPLNYKNFQRKRNHIRKVINSVKRNPF